MTEEKEEFPGKLAQDSNKPGQAQPGGGGDVDSDASGDGPTGGAPTGGTGGGDSSATGDGPTGGA